MPCGRRGCNGSDDPPTRSITAVHLLFSGHGSLGSMCTPLPSTASTHNTRYYTQHSLSRFT
ncbi:hypothetical protein E2C01_033988 [Portunus trituberculatus]|uniref:Uncharacterized protein n=1 Tax=Portunus trituberculatus TaxID=210409 RepID=A0A5B7EZC0_PORTR|nr:hypothetical protein [Portunus trituberculatus]